MLNFQTVYRHAEEHTRLILLGLFALLGLLIVLQSIFSPLAVVSAVVALFFLCVSVYRPLWSLAFLSLYLPFESFLLKFVPDDIYVFARYFSEGLIYVLAGVVLWQLLTGLLQRRSSPIDLAFVLFLIALVSSFIVNWVPLSVGLFGLRQILRFVIVFFIVFYLRPKKQFILRLTFAMIAVLALQSVLGISQAVIGEPIDQLLLPSESRSLGEITLTSGVEQFWEPGSRVFATLGRYDRLGNILYIFLLFAVAMLYEKKLEPYRRELRWFLALALPTLVLTFSRASWFAFLLGFLFIGLLIKRDRRVLVAFLTFVIITSSYLALSGLRVRFITEAPGQTLVERFYETFSTARWRGEYYGLGRVFWYVQTPLTVIPASPVFGFGPGQFGGGVVKALHHTPVYDKLGLPFGIWGSEGHIDNSWFSLWGEAGTLGLLFFLWMYVGLFVFALRTYRKSDDPFVRALCLGFAAVLIGVAFNAFLSTWFEIRTSAFYLWMYAGFVAVLGNENMTRRVTDRNG